MKGELKESSATSDLKESGKYKALFLLLAEQLERHVFIGTLIQLFRVSEKKTKKNKRPVCYIYISIYLFE